MLRPKVRVICPASSGKPRLAKPWLVETEEADSVRTAEAETSPARVPGPGGCGQEGRTPDHRNIWPPSGEAGRDTTRSGWTGVALLKKIILK